MLLKKGAEQNKLPSAHQQTPREPQLKVLFQPWRSQWTSSWFSKRIHLKTQVLRKLLSRTLKDTIVLSLSTLRSDIITHTHQQGSHFVLDNLLKWAGIIPGKKKQKETHQPWWKDTRQQTADTNRREAGWKGPNRKRQVLRVKQIVKDKADS